MTELSFLVDLLLNHKLPKATKDAVAARIKEVESGLAAPTAARGPVQTISMPAALLNQPPSTREALLRHPDLVAQMHAQPTEPAPVAIIAQTPATAAAMASRAQAIADSLAGKTDKLTGRPRKF